MITNVYIYDTATSSFILYDSTSRISSRMRIASIPGCGHDSLQIVCSRLSLSTSLFGFEGQAVKIECDGIMVWAGIIETVQISDHVVTFTANHMNLAGCKFPIISERDSTSTVSFNMDPNDPRYLPALAGRTVGQACIETLEMTSIASNLIAAGIGNIVPGSGAAASSTVAAGVVTGATVIAGGSGYSSSNKPSVVFVGACTTPATGTVTITSGAVASITITSGGSGYKVAPRVIISRLPSYIVKEFIALDMIPAHEISITGDNVFQALDSFIRGYYPSRRLHIDGYLDFRIISSNPTSNPTRVTFTGGGGSGALAIPIINESGAISSIAVIDGGSGYTSAPTAAIVGTGSGATLGTPTLSSGKVTAVSVTTGGTGYSKYFGVAFIEGKHQVQCGAVTRAHGECYGRVLVRGAAQVEGTEFALSKGTIVENFGYGTLTNAQAKAAWKYSDYDKTTSVGAGATATANLTATSVANSFQILNAGTGGTTGTGYTGASSGGGGTGFAFTYDISGGAVTNITRTAAGSGYTSPPVLTFPSGGVSGAVVKAKLTGTTVASLSITSPGVNYGFTPIIYVDAPTSGTRASFTATVASGSVTGTSVVSNGSGYTDVPNVRIQGPFNADSYYGTCEIRDSGGTIRFYPDDPTAFFSANELDQTLSGRQGVAFVFNTAGTDITSGSSKRITANTALVPSASGGIYADLTVDDPILDLSCNVCTIKIAGSGKSRVYRDYKILPSAIAKRMTNEPFQFGFFLMHGTGLQGEYIKTNTGLIMYSSNGSTPYNESVATFDIDPNGERIIFHRPTVWYYGTQSNLNTGGDSVDGIPNDIRVIIGVYKDSLTQAFPEDVSGTPQYSGTFYAKTGNARTKIVNTAAWRDYSQRNEIKKYAEEIHKSISNIFIDGSMTWYSCHGAILTPYAMVNVQWGSGSSGIEDVWVPVTSSSATMTDESTMYVTQLNFSNHTDRYTSTPELHPPLRPIEYRSEDVFNPIRIQYEQYLKMNEGLLNEIPRIEGELGAIREQIGGGE